MESNRPQNDTILTPAMRRLIELRLKDRLRQQSLTNVTQLHPDDDLINAFVEGRLEDAESASLISHLVGCANCLHLTSQLVRFEPGMDDVGSSIRPADDPGPLRRFLDRISDGALPSIAEDAVFAYEEKDPATDRAEIEQKADKDDLSDHPDR